MTVPLQGITVLDLSRLLPGPFCSQMLADFGAEVIKVEDTGRGDYLRDFPPKLGRHSSLYYSVNRNKKSIKLDLKQQEGKDAFRRLVAKSDVVLEGFRPGVMDKLGLGYEELKKVNPRIIYCAITGYGLSGPYKFAAGHDVNYLNYAGVSGLIGEKDGKPAMGDIQIADIGGGAMMGVISILLALQARQITGQGQLCDVSMMDGVVSWLPFVLARLASGEEAERGTGLLGGGYACYHIYPTQDGRYVSLGALEDKFWATFCTRLGKEDFIPIQMDVSRQQEMIDELNAILSKKTQAEWVAFFAKDDICFSPVLTMSEAVENPQVLSREMIYDTVVEGKNIKLPGIPVKLSDTPGVIKATFPEHGEHSVELLERAGYTKEEISSLAGKGVI